MDSPLHYSASDLARWGLLEAARREEARDALMASVAPPSAAVLAAARQQWLALLAKQSHDPARAGTSLAALQLSDSASTGQAFARRYGCTPAAYRRGARAVQPA